MISEHGPGGSGVDRPAGPGSPGRRTQRPRPPSGAAQGVRKVGSWRQREAPREGTERVVVGLGTGPGSREAARWVLEHFAPGASSVLVELGDGGGGRSAARLAKEVDAHNAGLVVVPPPRERGSFLERFWSTAECAARHCRAAVLVVREPPEGAPRRILVPVGPWGLDPRVARWARRLSKRFAASIVAVRVVDLTAPVHEEHRAFQEAYLREARGRLVAQLREAGLSPDGVEARVVVDEPRTGIVAAAEALDADLILLGSHGAGMLERLLIANVSGWVVRRARCPVLLVPEGTLSNGTA